MYRLGIYYIAIIFIVSIPVWASGHSLRISVSDTGNSPLPGATIQLMSLEDSTRVFAITDQSGTAFFERLKAGLFQLNISYIGFETLETNLNIREDLHRVEFILRDDIVSLGEFVVTARRPLIRQEADKMIIDPEPLATISTNTLEVLESTPGLFVDPDGGVFLSGATPATILINGREQRMSNQDIQALLRSLPPSSVDRIEVMRTPSARYAAASSGGIINIVLKRGYKIGRFGSVNSGMNQGTHGNRFLGFNFNNGGTRGSSYLNMSYNRNNALEELSSSRLLRTDTTLFQAAETRREAHQGFVGFGLSHDASVRLVLSYDGRVNGSLPKSSTNNHNRIAAWNDEPISETSNLIDNASDFLNIRQEAGVVFRIDTMGSDWETRISYAFNRNDGTQKYLSSNIFPFPFETGGSGDNAQRRHFLQFQSDLSYRLPWDISLETGISSAYQDYRSDSDFFFTLQEMKIPDPTRTNAFNYQERISAAYLQASRPLPAGIILKSGVRLEHTSMVGNQTFPADTSFVVDRTDWFPYVYLSRPIVEIAGYELQAFLIYRKTITRPGYQSLNPYINYIDQFLYETGNPSLLPQFSENLEANISMNDMPIFAVGRRYTRDIFSSVVYQDPVRENVAVRTYDNLGKNTETYFRAIGAIPPGGTYFFVAGAQYDLNEYEGFYENQPLNFRRGSWRLFTFHSLRLGPNTRLTMNGFLMTNGQMGFYELDNFGQLNFGLNQSFMDRKLTISLSARDVLRTMVTGFTLNQGSIQSAGQRYADNRRFGINIRYNFGIPDRRERENPLNFDIGD
jgi:iron complex outermembrane recepter protein